MQSNIIYHYTSLRFKELWKPFVETLNNKYLSQIPTRDHLLILGGSSAHCLNNLFLNQFSRITIFDIDKLAPVLFKLRHGFLRNTKYIIDDVFSDDGLNLNFKKTIEIIESCGPDAILFSNVIGQLPIYYKSFFNKKLHVDWSHRLIEKLNSWPWLSYHDVFSIQRMSSLPLNIHIEKQDSLESLLKRYQINSVVQDHMVMEQGWPRPSVGLRWDLHSQNSHFIEVTSNFAMRKGE